MKNMIFEQVLIIDNFDSFTYNLKNLLISLLPHSAITVLQNKISKEKIKNSSPDLLLLGPGPGNIYGRGDNQEIIHSFKGRIPIIGICLGMQSLNHYLGGRTVKVKKIIHGKTSKLQHNNKQLMKNLPQNLHVARYHSMAIIPHASWEIFAWSQNIPMIVYHKILNTIGLQFHPESFMTEQGTEIMRRVLRHVSV